MLSNITSNSPKEPNSKQASLQGGDRVYLYSDPKYTGRLIRPVERTYPLAPDKLIPLDKIKPPRPRKRPTPPEKEAYPLFNPDEVIRWRNMGLPKCS